MVSEDFKEFFMDCQLAHASTLSWMWVIETLARSNQVDVSLLIDLLKTPELPDAISRKARELVSLRILENISVLVAHENSVSSNSSTKIRFDPSESCEDALLRILPEASTSNQEAAQLEMFKWDYGPFIAHKKSSMAKCALQQLKDAILTESHPLASLKDQSGLSICNQSGVSVDECKCDDITPRLDGNDTNTQIVAENNVLITPLANGSHLLHRNLPDTNLSLAKRTRSTSTKKVRGRQLADTSTVIVPFGKEERCTSVKGSRVVGKGKNVPPGDDNHRCSSVSDEVFPCEKQVYHWGAEVPNEKSDEKLEQDQDVEEAKVDKEGFGGIKTHEDVDQPNIQKDAPYIGEGEEDADRFLSNNGAYHNDRTDITTNMDAYFGPQFMHSPDSSAKTDYGHLNLLAYVATRILQNSEREICSLPQEVHVGVMGYKRPSEDGNDKHNLSKRRAGLNEFLPYERQAPQNGMDVSNETFDEEQEQDHDVGDVQSSKKGVRELKTDNEGMEPEKNIRENVPNVCETDDVNISSDNDGYHYEQTDIPSQKNAFLSSQFANNQDFWVNDDWRELNPCIKCNKGEKLLYCRSNSGISVIHKSCLDSGASFDTRSGKYLKKKSRSSYGMIQNHFEPDDHLCRSNEQIGDFAEKVKKYQGRKKRENEQTGFSVLSSCDKPPEKSVDLMNGIANNLNEDKPKGNWMGKESQSPRVHGQHQMTAQANCKSHGGNTEIRCKKRVLCQSETDLPSENTFSPSTESTCVEEMSVEENENSSASKNVRVRKQERPSSSPENSQSRRKRLVWTKAEEQKLEEAIERFCGPDARVFPWKKILEFGAGVFHPSRSTIDLKDKYRNICKAKRKA